MELTVAAGTGERAAPRPTTPAPRSNTAARGVIVSNHGGRQLDGVVPTAVVLEEIAAAVAPAPVLVDGGIRTGRDVLRALCLGARAVLIGRPYLWALAIGGEAGVRRAARRRWQLELENALALTGCRSPAEADRSPAPVRLTAKPRPRRPHDCRRDAGDA